MRRPVLSELAAWMLAGAALGASLVGCTAAQREQARTVVDVVQVGCAVAELVDDDGTLRRLCLAPEVAARLFEHLGGAGASGAAGQAGASGAGGGS